MTTVPRGAAPDCLRTVRACTLPGKLLDTESIFPLVLVCISVLSVGCFLFSRVVLSLILLWSFDGLFSGVYQEGLYFSGAERGLLWKRGYCQ